MKPIPSWRRELRAREASQHYGCSKAYLYVLEKEGLITARRIVRRGYTRGITLFSRRDLDKVFAPKPSQETTA